MTNSAPHQTRIGNREWRHVLTVVRRLCGHPETGPNGVDAQSIDRISAPISPPPARTECRSGLTGVGGGVAVGETTSVMGRRGVLRGAAPASARAWVSVSRAVLCGQYDHRAIRRPSDDA